MSARTRGWRLDRRRQPRGFARVRDGALEVVLLEAMQSQVPLRQSVAGVDVPRALEGLRRFVVASQRRQRDAQVAQRIRITRMVVRVLLQLAGGFSMSAEGQELTPKQVANLGDVGDGGAEMRDLLVGPSCQLQLGGQVAMRSRVRRPAVEDRLPERQAGEIFGVP